MALGRGGVGAAGYGEGTGRGGRQLPQVLSSVAAVGPRDVGDLEPLPGSWA